MVEHVSGPPGIYGTNDVDFGFEFYVCLDNAGNVGLAMFIIATCEFPGTRLCSTDDPYTIYYSNSLQISGANYQADKIDLLLYWCTTSACKAWNNNGVGVWIFDYRDSNLSPSFYTIEDYVTTSYENHYFFYGFENVQCPLYQGNYCNPPYSQSYAYQIGFSSNQPGVSSSSWLIEVSNPGYAISGHCCRTVLHASTMGAQCFIPPVATVCQGGAYWHADWSWGGSSPQSDVITAVEGTPVDALTASQVNGQTFTATQTSSPPTYECVSVTNYAGIKSAADGAGEGNWAIGVWIGDHSWANGQYWNVLSSGTCPYLTWGYANGYQIPDKTQLW